MPDDTAPHGDEAPTPAGAPPPAPPAPVAQPTVDVGRGLQAWLGILAVFGGGGILLGQEELAFLVVTSGVFIAAQAADLEPAWETLYRAVLAVVVLFTAFAFVALGVLIGQMDLTPGLRVVLIGSAGFGAIVTLLTLYVPFANALVRLLFRVPRGSHTLRLAARLTTFGLLLGIPGWFATRELFETLFEDPSRLFEGLSLGGGLIGYVLLALASVGLFIRRDAAATLRRLGIERPGPGGVAFMVAGAALLFALNGAGEVIQRNWLPSLWEQDRRMTEMIAGNLGPGALLLLGLSAGVGEEITLRGGLQPKLGILLTSILFAALHVQYSWFGILMIFTFGCVLGVIRARTSTTVAIGVHTLYDVVALLLT